MVCVGTLWVCVVGVLGVWVLEFSRGVRDVFFLEMYKYFPTSNVTKTRLASGKLLFDSKK